MDPFEYDQSVRRDGYSIIAGVDEAGRGPLAGPVVAAAVILPEGLRIPGLRDSKKVREREREVLYEAILSKALDVGVSVVDAEEIDRTDILRATKLAMHNALGRLKRIPDIILIDALRLQSVKIEQLPIIKGDAKSASIAAASIMAKVTRDRVMMRYHSEFPQYGFDRHKGYGTKAHLDKINRYGPCPIHRKTFRKVMDMQLPFE